MSRPVTRDTTVSQAVQAAIKRYCFGNISQFYKIYRKNLKMSRATFYRAMSNENTTLENALTIEAISKRLRLMDSDGSSSYTAKQDAITYVFEALDRMLKDPSADNVSKLKKVYTTYKPIIISNIPA